MQFCMMHWEQLRAAITERGLDHLIASDGKELVERMEREIDNKQNKQDFDPFMSAHNMILSNALHAFGFYIMGDCCPLCELDKEEWQENSSAIWIRSAADSVLSYATEQKLQG